MVEPQAFFVMLNEMNNRIGENMGWGVHVLMGGLLGWAWSLSFAATTPLRHKIALVLSGIAGASLVWTRYPSDEITGTALAWGMLGSCVLIVGCRLAYTLWWHRDRVRIRETKPNNGHGNRT